MEATATPRIAIYHQHLHGGGATQVVLHLADAFLGAGYAVDLVVNTADGSYANRVADGVRVVSLKRSSQERARLDMLRAARTDWDLWLRSLFVSRKELDKLLYLPSLTRYLKQTRPTVLIANLWQLAIAAVSARAIAAHDTRVVCIFHSSYFYQCGVRYAKAKKPRKWRRFLAYCSRVYARADALVTVSHGIANDLVTTLGLPRSTIQTIYNPVVPSRAKPDFPELPDHPWFRSHELPIVLAVGRLSPEKNYDELLRAFAIASEQREARLIILGEGDGRGELTDRIAALGLSGSVDLPGWVGDPSLFLYHAQLFVLPSLFEGLGNALIEAIACGCSVVCYDCPHGPREILDNGTYGKLVPAGDVHGLGQAIVDALDNPVDSALLIKRAETFSVEQGKTAYLRLIHELAGPAVHARDIR